MSKGVNEGGVIESLRPAKPSVPILTLNDYTGQICDYCGEEISSNPQKCMALDDGWCRP